MKNIENKAIRMKAKKYSMPAAKLYSLITLSRELATFFILTRFNTICSLISCVNRTICLKKNKKRHLKKHFKKYPNFMAILYIIK